MQKQTVASVARNRGFLNLWFNQILVQLSYNSLNFALIIWVFRLTNSSTANAGLLAMIYLPAAILGLFAGVVIDITDRRLIIRTIDILLAAAFFSLVFLKSSYTAILLIVFFVSALAQFYTPAESSAIPIIVKKKQLLLANSLFSTTLYASFLLGFGLAGLLINRLGIDMVFILGGILLTLAFLLSFLFPPITARFTPEGAQLSKALKAQNIPAFKHIALGEIQKTLSLIRGHLHLLSSVLILTGVQMVIGILAVLIPGFLEKNLQINAANASYILIIPLGTGMVAGGLLIGRLGHLFVRRKLVGGAITFAGILFLLAGLSPIVSPVSKILSVGSFLLGMAMVAIIVPSQTVLQENTPEETRGKVFAVLAVAMAALSLVPILVAGLLADIFGVLPIIFGLGGVIFLIGLFTLKPSLFFRKQDLPFKVREFLGLGHWRKK